jgi:hypothetical protein
MMAGGDTMTERTDGAPQCGGDVDALTLAISLPHTVVGDHFRLTPWFGLDSKKVFARCGEQLGECVCEIKVRFTKHYFAN